MGKISYFNDIKCNVLYGSFEYCMECDKITFFDDYNNCINCESHNPFGDFYNEDISTDEIEEYIHKNRVAIGDLRQAKQEVINHINKYYPL